MRRYTYVYKNIAYLFVERVAPDALAVNARLLRRPGFVEVAYALDKHFVSVRFRDKKRRAFGKSFCDDVFADERAHEYDLCFQPRRSQFVENTEPVEAGEQQFGNDEIGFLFFDQLISADSVCRDADDFQIGSCGNDFLQFHVPLFVILNDNDGFLLQ